MFKAMEYLDPYIDFAVVYLGHQLLPSFSYFAKLGIFITEHRYLEYPVVSCRQWTLRVIGLKDLQNSR
jgi:hypothetical protein